MKGDRKKVEFKKWLLIPIFIISFIVSININLFSSSPKNVYADENLISYALSWRLNSNIPYVYGGDRNSSLEEIAATSGKGTDCSGFVRLVYKHFGVDIPGTSATILSSPNGRHFYSISDAKPGDICHWDGHVALYLGGGRIIHTNTSNPGSSGKDNLIHVSIIDADLAGTSDAEGTYRFPEVFIRFLDDDALMGGADSPVGDIMSEETQHEVNLAAPTGSLVTESDLTGMPTEWSLEDAQKKINLGSLENLSSGEQKTVIGIKEGMEFANSNIGNAINIIMLGIGIILMVYSMVIIICFMFDKSNQFIDISFLSIVSLGKWVLLSDDDVTINGGADKKTYITGKGIIVRALIVLALSFLFISGLVSRVIWFLVGLVIK